MDLWIIWSTCLALLLICALLLAKRSKGITLLRRLLFLILGLVGAGLILSRPTIQKEIAPTTVHLQTHFSQFNPKEDLGKDEHSFDNVHEFLSSEISKKTSDIHVYGLGLNPEELVLVEDYNLSFHPVDTIDGIYQLDIPNITEREDWTLNGKYQGSGVQLIEMISPDGNIHKADLLDKAFSINSVAPAAGSYLYDIKTYTLSDTITEALPITVFHEPTWSMLVLSSFPSFEINYLKSYWTSLGNQFAIRSQVSQNKYNTSFVNSPSIDLDNLSYRTVSAYDFIIADIISWNQLTNDEKRNIKTAIINQGLSLILRATDENTQPEEIQIPTLNSQQDIAWKSTSDEITLSIYPTTSAWRSASQQGHTLLKYRSSGLGHIGILTIDETYKLILGDQKKSYQNLWSAIFSKLYRDFSPSSKLILNDWIWEGESTSLSILSSTDIHKSPILNDSIELSFIETPFLEGVTDVNLLPNEGLNTIQFNQEEELLFYAHKKESWFAVRQHLLSNVNREKTNLTSDHDEKSLFEPEQISLIWWYSLALIGMGGLWLDERIYH